MAGQLKIMNSYGFNGEIPAGALAAEYDIDNRQFTGKFFFSAEEIDPSVQCSEKFAVPVFSVYKPISGTPPKNELFFLDLKKAKDYALNGANVDNIRHVVKNLVEGTIEMEFGFNEDVENSLM